jgi:hypothetical protein
MIACSVGCRNKFGMTAGLLRNSLAAITIIATNLKIYDLCNILNINILQRQLQSFHTHFFSENLIMFGNNIN